MNSGYDDTLSNSQKRTSPKEKVNNLAKVLRVTQKHQDLTPEEKAAMDDFFNSGPGELEYMSYLYLNIVERNEKSDVYQTNQTANGYLQDINEIMNRLVESSSRPAKFQPYFKEINLFTDIFFDRISEFISENSIEDFSVMGGYESMQQLLGILFRYTRSYRHAEQLEELEKRFEAKNLKLDSRLGLLLVRSYVFARRKSESIGIQLTGEKYYSFQKCEGYLLRHAAKVIQTGNIDEIWQDELLNVILQLRAVNQMGNFSQNRQDFVQLEEKIADLLEKVFTPQKVEEAKETLERTVKKSKDKVFENPEEQKDFLNAYKLVYLSELLKKKQRDPSATPPDYALFIIMQMENFDRKSLYSDVVIHYSTLLMRLAQDIIIKENQRQLTTYKVIEGKNDDKLVVLNHPGQQFHHTGGSSTSELQIINMCTEGLLSKNKLARFFIKTMYHELDHQDRERESNKVGFHDYIGLKCVKSMLLWNYEKSIQTANYHNLIHEKSANLSGCAAAIRVCKEFSAGKDPEEIEKTIDEIVEDEKSNLDKVVGSKINIKNPDTNTWEELSDIQAYDNIVLKKNRTMGSAIWQILQFEYHEDGTPKKLEEIIQDQEDELSGQKKMYVGPIKSAERAKIKFQTMIERAMYTGEEEKCLRLINEFAMSHQELFENDRVLGQVYAPETLKEDLKAKKEEALREGTQEGIQDAIFIHVMEGMVERISQKQVFRDDMFDFLFKSKTGKNTEKADVEAQIATGSLQTQEQLQDEPEDQTPQ